MKIICLANSYKRQGRCIAGIEIDSGRWIRPVSDLDDGQIPIEDERIDAENIAVLDIVDIPIDPVRKASYEIENYRYTEQAWRVADRAKIIDLLGYCERELLYREYGGTIPFDELIDRSPVRTLQLIEVKSLYCYRNARNRWKAKILDEGYYFSDFELSITDPIALEKLNQGKSLSPHCLICISLSKPWQATPIDDFLCYRLVAGIIELLPELEMILQEMERVGWDKEKGRQYLRERFHKESRYQLSSIEARRFLRYLQNLPSGNI